MSRNCRDCIHYQVCASVRDDNYINFDGKWFPDNDKIRADGCPYYKSRDEVIELPCKLGDKIYCVYYFLGQFEILERYIYDINLDHNGVTIRTLTTNERFNLDELNKNFFLTRAGAEARVKELENG